MQHLFVFPRDKCFEVIAVRYDVFPRNSPLDFASSFRGIAGYMKLNIVFVFFNKSFSCYSEFHLLLSFRLSTIQITLVFFHFSTCIDNYVGCSIYALPLEGNETAKQFWHRCSLLTLTHLVSPEKKSCRSILASRL